MKTEQDFKPEEKLNAESGTTPKKPAGKLEPAKLKKAVLYFCGAMLIGSAIVAMQTEYDRPVTTGLTDQIVVNRIKSLGRNYTNAVAVNSKGPTKLYLYDCGSVDKDIVEINGMRVTLPPPSTPLAVELPVPVAGLQIQAIDDGDLTTTTLGITSELKSVTCVGLSPGEATLVPTVLR